MHAGQVVKEVAPIVGGGGGGRPDFAEAGGKDPSKIDELLTQSRLVIERMLGGGASEAQATRCTPSPRLRAASLELFADPRATIGGS